VILSSSTLKSIIFESEDGPEPISESEDEPEPISVDGK
jgi:hypothetical protein